MGRPKGSKNKPKDPNAIAAVKATAKAAKAPKVSPAAKPAKPEKERKEWKPGSRGRKPAWYIEQQKAAAADTPPPATQEAPPPKPTEVVVSASSSSPTPATAPAKPASNDTGVITAIKSGELDHFVAEIDKLLVAHMSDSRREFFEEQGIPGLTMPQRVAKLVLQFFEISPAAVANT